MAGLQTLSDLAALARAGFKASDIKEIMASEQPKEEKPAEILPKEEEQPAPENSLPKEEKPAEILPKEEEQPAPENSLPKEEKASDEPDYKKMFEDEQKRAEKLASDLEKAQKVNIKQPVKEESKLSNQEQINKMYLNLL